MADTDLIPTGETTANALLVLRSMLNEASASFWADAELTYYLQLAAVKISSLFGGLETASATAALGTGATSVTIPDDVHHVEAVLYDGTRGLIRVHPRQIGHLAETTAGPPRYFAVFARKIYFAPATTSAETAKTFTVLGWKSTQNIYGLDEPMKQAAIILAAAYAKIKDRKFAESQALMTMAYSEAERARALIYTNIPNAKQDMQIPDVTTVMAG